MPRFIPHKSRRRQNGNRGKEQGNLIGSDKVEGTEVYDANSESNRAVNDYCGVPMI
jgi:hypothetical protein